MSKLEYLEHQQVKIACRRRLKKQFKIGECLLQFGLESYVLPCKYCRIQSHNLPISFVRVRKCSLALREGHSLKMLRDSNIGPKREDRENCIMKIFMIAIHLFIAKYYSGDEIRRMKCAVITASEGRRELHTGLW